MTNLQKITVNPRSAVRHILRNYEPKELEDTFTDLIESLCLPAAEPEKATTERVDFDRFIERVTQVDGPTVQKLRVHLAVSVSDKVAGEILKEIMQKLGPDATAGEIEDVLLNALFWLRLFLSNDLAHKWEANTNA